MAANSGLGGLPTDEVIRALDFSPALHANNRLLALESTVPRGGDGAPPLASFGGSAAEPLAPQPAGACAAGDVLKVYVRVRPTQEPEEEHCVRKISETELLFSKPGLLGGGVQEGYGERYTFTRAFDPRTSNGELFEQTTLPLVRDLFCQRDGLLFAYGVTNAGKTHTIQGSKEDPGVVPRALKLIFASLDEIDAKRATQSAGSLAACRHDMLGVQVNMTSELRVVLSYLEVYNENVFDLLADQLSGIHAQRTALKTKEDSAGRIFIPGLKEIQVSSYEESLAVVHYGAQQRQVAQTRLNSDSSRSHAILTVQLCRVGASAHDSSVSRLCVVDLAGAERTARTQTGGVRLKEASKINTSLLTLGRCMEVLRANAARPKGVPARVVPFRESKMTRLLHDYFVSGSGTMQMVVAVHPGAADADETAHTLRFSAVARDVHAMDLKYPSSGPLSLRAAAAHKRPAPAQPLAAFDDDEDVDELELDADAGSGEDLRHQLGSMRRRLMETEARCLSLEAEIRDEVAVEMAEALAEMEATYRSRLEGGNTEERHLEKLNLYKQASARKAERDATASHLQLVERVKEYERALVSGEEAHAAALADAHAQHEARMADALARHAAELRGVQAAHEAQLRTLSSTSRDGRGLQAALEAASQRAEQLAAELGALRADNESLRDALAANESRAAAELAEKEAQLSCNMRLEVESLEFQLRDHAVEKRRLTARVAELEGRLHELIAVAQHNMVHGVHDGSEKPAKGAKGGKDGKAPANAQPRADGRTLTLGATAAMPPKAGLLASASKGAALRYEILEVVAATPPQAGGEHESGGAIVYTGELRRTATKDGVGMVLVGVGGADENSQPALPPTLRANSSSESKRKLDSSGAPATDGASDGDDEPADGDHPFTAAAHAHGESKRARGSGSERALEPLLPSTKQPAADAPPSDDRTKAIAAKVAARELEAAARKPAASKGMLGLSFSRKAKAEAAPVAVVATAGPTPIAARTRLRGGLK